MTLCESSVCYCGMEDEDLHHALWVCPLYEEARREMMDGISCAEVGPIYYGDLVSSPANFARLQEFAHKWYAARSQMERLEKLGILGDEGDGSAGSREAAPFGENAMRAHDSL